MTPKKTSQESEKKNSKANNRKQVVKRQENEPRKTSARPICEDDENKTGINMRERGKKRHPG